jgi:tetratricopeptide (TPR) repeat protein
MQRAAAEISLWRQDLPSALNSAALAVPPGSKDYRDHVWLGYIQAAAGETTKAEKAFRQAIKLARREPAPRVALIQHLARIGRLTDAKAEIQKARRHMAGKYAGLALARCYESIGEAKVAERLYLKAREARPDDVPTLRSVATFYLLQRDYQQAQKILQQIINLKIKARAEKAWARRMLAFVMALKGDYQQLKEALSQLDLVDQEGPGRGGRIRAQTLRTKALLLATRRTRSQRKEAIEILESIVNKPSPEAGDMYFLAQLYNSVDDWPNARRWLERLVDSHDKQPVFLAYYALSLVRRGENRAAEEILKKLRRLPGQEGTFATVRIEAQLRAGRGKSEKAVDCLEAYVNSPKSKPDQKDVRLLLTAALLDQLSQQFPKARCFGQKAEEFYQKTVTRQPKKILDLIAFLGRQGRVEDVLRWGDKAWKTCPPEAVGNILVSALHGVAASGKQLRRVEEGLQKMRAKHPKLVSLVICLADLRDLQAQYDEAIKLYRDALRQDPRNLVGLNNLAWLLAVHQGKGEEALRLLKKAIQIAGPLPELKDTLGVIYLSLGKTNKAIGTLKEAIEEKPMAVGYFHLAQAYALKKKPYEAKEALQKAQRLKLQAQQLHALERNPYRDLLGQLGLK